MDFSIFQQEKTLPSLISSKLASIDLDYLEKHNAVKKKNEQGASCWEASVAVLINYKKRTDKPEYVFQLIKRSSKVTQAGDISCPGGMLLPKTDNFLGNLLRTGIIPALRKMKPGESGFKNYNTSPLIRLFLANALRESWEEIGLNPFNISFLGALPSYSLTSFPRIIFPLVCLTNKPFKYKLNSEVEKVVEVPLRSFFEISNYASLKVVSSQGESVYGHGTLFPSLIIPDKNGNDDILWGATFYIITNFLSIIFGDMLPLSPSDKIVKKIISNSYLSGNR